MQFDVTCVLNNDYIIDTRQVLDNCCPGLKIEHYDRTKTTQYILLLVSKIA